MKFFTNATIQDKVDGYEFGQIYKKDGIEYAKVRQTIYRKEDEDKWVIESENGIRNPDLHGVPKNCTGRRWSR